MTEDWQRFVDQANRHAKSVPTDWVRISAGIERGLARRRRVRKRAVWGATVTLVVATVVVAVMLKPEPHDPKVIEPAAPFTRASVKALQADCERELPDGVATEGVSASSADRSIGVALVRDATTALLCTRDDANSKKASVVDVTINPAPQPGDDVTMSTISTSTSGVYAAAAVVPDVAFLARTFASGEPRKGEKEARRNSDSLALNVLTFTGEVPVGNIDLTVFWFPDKREEDCGCEEPLATISRSLGSMPAASPTKALP